LSRADHLELRCFRPAPRISLFLGSPTREKETDASVRLRSETAGFDRAESETTLDLNNVIFGYIVHDAR